MAELPDPRTVPHAPGAVWLPEDYKVPAGFVPSQVPELIKMGLLPPIKPEEETADKAPLLCDVCGMSWCECKPEGDSCDPSS